MSDIYPLDIWHVIFQHSDLLSQLRLISVCSAFNRSFFITDMYNILDIYKDRLTEQILKQKKFKRIISLDIMCNINNISFLTNLKKLNTYSINQEGINGLDLIELYADRNEKIKDVSFMTNLKELDANCNKKIKNVSFMTNLKKLSAQECCGIDQEGIKECNLIELDAGYNEKNKEGAVITNFKKIFGL